jgi:dihydrofolate reductase
MIRLIAAMDSRRGIAIDGGIPWKLPGDTAYFHEKTASGLILMGWATYNEFAAPLHERVNFVLTSHSGALRKGFRATAGLDELVARNPDEDVWVIGGAAVFTETINESDELFLTQVVGDFRCTKFFPPYRSQFRRATESEDRRDGDITYRFEVWERLVSQSGASSTGHGKR